MKVLHTFDHFNNYVNSKLTLYIHLFITQFLLVDLRCHGDSASLKKRAPHSVASAALDVLKLVCISRNWFYFMWDASFTF